MTVDVEALAEGVVAGSRASLARAITLVESTRADHRTAAQELLRRLTPGPADLIEERSAGKPAVEPDVPPTASVRLGISGVPGAGKSTFINTLGQRLVADGHRVAVLAVDPSSSRSGGSILGDRTRMGELAASDAAYVRPSPTGLHLGGVARATRETMVVVEAAGFDVVVVETVGVGQSEVAVAGMVDTFLLLTLSRAGDQLQGIKRGILEIADVVAVNKADGDWAAQARGTARELSIALRLLRGGEGPRVPVLTCSGLTGDGMDEVWQAVLDHRAQVEHGVEGGLRRRRSDQQVEWLWALLREEVWGRFRASPTVRAQVGQVEDDIRAGRCRAVDGADRVLEAYRRELDDAGSR